MSSKNPIFEQAPVLEQMRDPLHSEWNKSLVEEANSDELIRLIDFSQMNDLFESFLDSVGLPVAIIDLKGAVLASSRWQRLCMEFHRVNEGTLARCIESDIDIYKQVESGKKFSSHKCKNGLIDCCSPIIVEGRHIANLFIGQFFVDKPDDAFFEKMVLDFGFDKKAYFEAVSEVPVVSEERLEPMMKMLMGWANHIADKSIAETRLKRALTSVEQEVQKRTAELNSAKDELKKFNAELQKRVDKEVANRLSVEAQRQKEHEALIQSEKMAQLGNMLAAILHQWKQPLNSIALETQGIKDSFEFNELDETEVQRVVKSIMDKIAFMSTTADDFKDFYKPSKEKKEFSIIEQVESVVQLLGKQLKVSNITLSINGDRSICATGYTSEFKQVVLNIINNAKDVFEERQVKDAIIAIEVAKDGGRAVLTLADNGKGIPKELLPDRLFESFSSTKGERGTGIGLSICKTIVEENMGGKLSAHNTEDGACFVLELPCA